MFAALLYSATIAPGLAWQDSGDAQVRVEQNDWKGIGPIARSHPTYYMVAWVIGAVLPLSAALTANIVSVIAGALTAANMAWIISTLIRRRLATVCGTLLLVCSHTFWQMSTVAEVYTLSAAFLTAELCMLVAFTQSAKHRYLLWLALFNGLSISTHNIGLLALPVYAVAAAIHYRWCTRDRIKTLAAMTVLWVLGFLPIIVLMIRWYGIGGRPFKSWLVGRYGESVFNADVTISLLGKVAGYFVLNFPTPLLILAPVGWWMLGKRIDRTLWWVLSGLAGVHLVFVTRYTVPDQYSFMIPTCLFTVIFIAGAIACWPGWQGAAMQRTAARRGLSLVLVGLSLLGPPAYALMPIVIERFDAIPSPVPKRDLPYRDQLRWFLRPWHCGDVGTERYCREALAQLPPDAVLLTESAMRGPLLYCQEAYGLRRDVQLDKGVYQLWLKATKLSPETAADLVSRQRFFATANHLHYPLFEWLVEYYQTVPDGILYRLEPKPANR